MNEEEARRYITDLLERAALYRRTRSMLAGEALTNAEKYMMLMYTKARPLSKDVRVICMAHLMKHVPKGTVNG